MLSYLIRSPGQRNPRRDTLVQFCQEENGLHSDHNLVDSNLYVKLKRHQKPSATCYLNNPATLEKVRQYVNVY